MWLQKPTAEAQRKGPYTIICGLRNPRRQHWGRDHIRSYMASETRASSTEEATGNIHNRPYVLIFV